jgi:y4mF family transcriptional regulator
MRSRGSTPPTTPAPDATQRLAAAVRARRKTLRLTQAELASLAGVGLAFLYELESGKSTVRIDKVLAVLEVLGLELHVRPGKQRISAAAGLDPGDA